MGKQSLTATFCLGLILVSMGPAVQPLLGQAKSVGFERSRRKMILKEVSREVEKNFYDADLHGHDWKALTAHAKKLIEKSNSIGEMDAAIFSLLNQLQDSHTFYIPPIRAGTPVFGFEAKAYGDEVYIYEVREGAAAAAASLEPGDRILEINGFQVDRGNFDLLMILLRVLRPVIEMEIVYSRGNDAPRTLRLRAEVKNRPIITDLTNLHNIYQLIREAESKKAVYRYNKMEGGIGYLYLPSFTGGQRFIRSLVNEVKNSRAMIVDLRGNPGGAVSVLEFFASFFESDSTIIADIVQRQKTKQIKAKSRKPNFPGPLFILVDSQSASAAEAFAYHFQHTGRGVVIGDHSSGRLTAANIYSKQIGTDTIALFAVQVATARVVFPDGADLEGKGVTPDHLCKPTAADLRAGRDPCLGLAITLAHKALEPAEETRE